MAIASGISTEYSRRAARNLSFHVGQGSGPGPDRGEGVLETTFVPCGAQSELVSFGSWPTEPDGPAVPIQWRVVGRRADGARLLIALDVLECRRAHDFKGDVTWQYSSLRYWLHKVFAPHAFTPGEEGLIQPMTLTTFDNEEFKTVGCHSTVDRIFLLSEGECRRFFPSDPSRIASFTTYATRLTPIPCWWLRSPGGNQFAFQSVSEGGALDRNGFHATLGGVGVRPALVLMPHPDMVETPRVAGAALLGYRASHDVGHALEYCDEKAYLAGIAHEKFTPSLAEVAVAGGYPSVKLINDLLDRDAFTVRNRYRLCQAAIKCKEYSLVKRIVSQGVLDESLLTHLLNASMSEGAEDMATFLAANGANAQGYAEIYLPSARSADVALCAVAVDPKGALACWNHVRTYPDAVRRLVSVAMGDRASLASLLAQGDLVSTCARYGMTEEVRALTERPHPSLTASALAEAAQAAKSAGHAELVALLLDRQATLFPSSSAMSRPMAMRTDTACASAAPASAPSSLTNTTSPTPTTPPAAERPASLRNRPSLEL